MEKVIVDGVPLKITVDDFKRRFLDKFPKMAFEHDEEIQNAIDSMYTIFHGVGKIWKWCDKQVWFNKTRECYGLLAAWYICSMYPEYAKGIASTGGFMVKRKKIGGGDITFKDGTYSAAAIKSI